MKLYIKEIAWGINMRDGGYKTRVTECAAFPCAVGDLPEFKAGGRRFSVDAVGEDFVVLSVHYENNPTANKTWTVRRGERAGYFPRSFDGGYRYEFEVK